MTRKLLPSLLSAVLWIAPLCLVPAIAMAHQPAGWYLGTGIAWTDAEDVRFDEALSESPDETGASVGFDFGAPAGSAAIGFAFENQWRVELEAAYRANDLEILHFPESGLEVNLEATDQVEATSFMVNVFRDFELGTALQPYVGAGIGSAEVKYRLGEFGIDTMSTQRPRRPIIDDKTTSVAYQLIAGFTIPITRRIDMTADYRYWQAPSVELEDALGAEVDVEHTVHSAWLSLRYHLSDQRHSKRNRQPYARERGFYLAGNFGRNWPPDAEIKNNLANFDAFDTGFLATLAAGYTLNDRWRFEVEAARRQNDVEVIDFNPEFGESRASGRVRATSYIAQAFYRFYPQSPIGPYLGLGGGLVSADYDVTVDDAIFIDDDDSALGFQGILGVDVAVTQRLTFVAEYRFWAVSKLEMRQPDDAPLNTKLRDHSMNVGLRYAFGASR